MRRGAGRKAGVEAHRELGHAAVDLLGRVQRYRNPGHGGDAGERTTSVAAARCGRLSGLGCRMRGGVRQESAPQKRGRLPGRPGWAETGGPGDGFRARCHHETFHCLRRRRRAVRGGRLDRAGAAGGRLRDIRIFASSFRRSTMTGDVADVAAGTDRGTLAERLRRDHLGPRAVHAAPPPAGGPRVSAALRRIPAPAAGWNGYSRNTRAPRVWRRLMRFLEQQTGQRFRGDIRRAHQWIWDQPYDPHPDYGFFKGQWYAQMDPRFADFFPRRVFSTIRLDEIDWGGVDVNLYSAAGVPRAPAGRRGGLPRRRPRGVRGRGRGRDPRLSEADPGLARDGASIAWAASS